MTVIDKVKDSSKDLFFPVQLFCKDLLSAIRSGKKMNWAGKLLILPLQLAFKFLMAFFVIFLTIIVAPIWLPYQYLFNKIYRLNPGKVISNFYKKLFFKD